MALTWAPPNFERRGVVAGFILTAQYETVYDTVEVLDGYDEEGNPVYREEPVERTVGSLAPALSVGVLCAQGAMWRPGANPVVPPAPAGAKSHLFYNSVAGLYWKAAKTPNAADDAYLGWVRTSADAVIATCAQRVGSGAEVSLVMSGPAPRREEAPLPEASAPNITAATAAAYYCDASGTEAATGVQYGLKGVITLPTENEAYGHLRTIHVVAIPPDGVERVVAVLTAPWEGGEVAWKSFGTWDRPGANVTFPRVEFRCMNGESAVTKNPYTVENVVITGQSIPPLLPTSVTAQELIAERYLETPSNLTYARVQVSVVMPENHRALWFTAWLSEDDGATWLPFDMGKFWFAAGAAKFVRIAPATAKTWRVKVATGNHSGENGPDVAVVSEPFAVGGLAAPGAGGVTGAAVGTFRTMRSGDAWYWGLDSVSWTNPTAAAEPSFFHSQLTVQAVDQAGNPAPADQGGTERAVDESDTAGAAASSGLVQWWEFPRAGSGYRFRFRLYVYNRAGARTLQTTCWAGADHYDVDPLAVFPAAPAISNLTAAIEYADFDVPGTGVVRKYRMKGSWAIGTGGNWDYYRFTRVKFLPQPAGTPVVLAEEREGFQTGWLDIGAPATYQLTLTPVNGLGVESAPQLPPTNLYSISGPGNTANVQNVAVSLTSQAVDKPTGRVKQWAANVKWALPANTTDFGYCVPTAVYTAPGPNTVELTGHETQAPPAAGINCGPFDVVGAAVTFVIEFRTYNKAGVMVANPPVAGPYTVQPTTTDIPVPQPSAAYPAVVGEVTGRFVEANSLVELAIPWSQSQPADALHPFLDVSCYVDHPDTAAGSATLGQTALGTTPLNPPFAPQLMGKYTAATNPIVVRLPIPANDENWRAYLVTNGNALGKHGTAGVSPNALISIQVPRAGTPQPGTNVSGQEWAPLVWGLAGGAAGNLPIEYRVEQGIPQYRWNVTFSIPSTDARYGGVAVTEIGQATTWTKILGANVTRFISEWYTAPLVATSLWLEFVSRDAAGHQNTIVAGVTPEIKASNVCRPAAAGGMEYATRVSLLSESDLYAYNGHGAYVLKVTVTWADPLDDPAYTGAVVYIRDVTNGEAAGGHAATGLVPRGVQKAVLEISNFPRAANTQWSVNVRSRSGLHENSYSNGVTPEIVFTVSPPQPASTVGREYCDNVTNPAVNAIDLAEQSDGTHLTLLQFSFTPPADPRWAAVNMRIQKTATGPWEMPTECMELRSNGQMTVSTPAGVHTWKFAFISHNKIGQENAYNPPIDGVTPVVEKQVGTPKKTLNIRQAAPEAYDGTVEVTGSTVATVDLTAATKTVTWKSGALFNTAWPAGMVIVVGGLSYSIAAVTNSFTLTVAEAVAGNLTGVQMTTTGAFRARAINLDYGGQITRIANETGSVGGGTGTVAFHSEAGERNVAQAPGQGEWSVYVGENRRAYAYINAQDALGTSYASLVVGSRNVVAELVDERHATLNSSQLQLYTKWGTAEYIIDIQAQQYSNAAVGAYVGKMSLVVGKPDGSGGRIVYIPLYAS